jgi:hypothetical protein
MEEFPGNSRRPTTPENHKVVSSDSVKLDSVVTGKVIKRKKPLGRRIREMFFSGDSNSVVGYLGKEVLLPALQNLITDFVTQGIEKAVYGEVRTNRPSYRGGSTAGTRISYDRYASPQRPNPPTAPVRRAITQPNSLDIGEIILDTKIEAQLVAEKLFETVEEYGVTTVGHLYELIGQTPVQTDHRFGWTNLETLEIKRVREGWLLVLPYPIDVR